MFQNFQNFQILKKYSEIRGATSISDAFIITIITSSSFIIQKCARANGRKQEIIEGDPGLVKCSI